MRNIEDRETFINSVISTMFTPNCSVMFRLELPVIQIMSETGVMLLDFRPGYITRGDNTTYDVKIKCEQDDGFTGKFKFIPVRCFLALKFICDSLNYKLTKQQKKDIINRLMLMENTPSYNFNLSLFIKTLFRRYKF